jgi:hypothetical protein
MRRYKYGFIHIRWDGVLVFEFDHLYDSHRLLFRCSEDEAVTFCWRNNG